MSNLEFKIHAKFRIDQRSRMRRFHVEKILEHRFYERIGMDLKKKNVCHYACYSIIDNDYFILVIDEKSNSLITVLPIYYASWKIDPDLLLNIKEKTLLKYNFLKMNKEFSRKTIEQIGRIFSFSYQDKKNKDLAKYYKTSAVLYSKLFAFGLLEYMKNTFTHEDIEQHMINSKKSQMSTKDNYYILFLKFYLSLNKKDFNLNVNDYAFTKKRKINFQNVSETTEKFREVKNSIFQKIYFQENLQKIFQQIAEDDYFPKYKDTFTVEDFSHISGIENFDLIDYDLLVSYIKEKLKIKNENGLIFNVFFNNKLKPIFFRVENPEKKKIKLLKTKLFELKLNIEEISSCSIFNIKGDETIYNLETLKNA